MTEDMRTKLNCSTPNFIAKARTWLSSQLRERCYWLRISSWKGICSLSGMQREASKYKLQELKSPKTKPEENPSRQITENGNTDRGSWRTIFMMSLVPSARNTVPRKGCVKQAQRCFWVWCAATTCIWHIHIYIHTHIFLSEFYSWGIRHWAWPNKVLKKHPRWTPLRWNTPGILMQRLLPKERDLLENTSIAMVNWSKHTWQRVCCPWTPADHHLQQWHGLMYAVDKVSSQVGSV